MKAVASQGPVTAAKFVGNGLMLAGSGSFLKVYDWRSSQLLHEVQIFPIDKVHGIAVHGSGSRAVIWGGRSLALVSVIGSDVASTGGSADARVAIDKVLSCKDRIIDTAVLESALYVLTAHNEVLELDLNAPEKTCRTHKCSERSILYSGSLFITPAHRFVGAGTVFGGVVVWDLDTDTITHKFETHEGSIFDVAWSEDGEYVASCSDDRSVIVSSLRSHKLVARGWGHASRIWKLRFASEHCLISAAEDCSARVWQFTSGEDLECTRVLMGHQGRSIWSIDLHVDDNVLATGGGDGKIMLWDLASESTNEVEQWELAAKFEARVRSCAIGPLNGSLAVTLVNGACFYKAADSQDWQRVDVKLGPVPVIKAAESRFYAVASDGSGLILSQKTGALESSFSLNERVQDFFVLDDSRLVVTPTPPSTSLLIIDCMGGEVVRSFNQHPGVGIVTSVASLGPHAVCIGSRNGALSIYDESSADAVKVVPAALGTKTDAITDIKVVRGRSSAAPLDPSSGNLDSTAYILVTARSSDYGYFALPNLTRLFKNRARKRGSVEGANLHGHGVLFWGFQKDDFLIWNAKIGFEMARINSGGVYRAWDCCVLPWGVCFAFVRAGELYLHKIRAPSTKFAQPLLQQGTHGREIRGMELCPANPRLIATGSEDTVVSIGWINARGTNIRNACSVKDGHISGIQCLHWNSSGEYLLTGAGNGELVMWEVTVRGEAVFANEVGRMPTKNSTLRELRVMEFSVHKDLVAVAYSDSSFRIWKLKPVMLGDVKKFNFELLLESRYRESCLLNIDLLELRGQLWLAITSTDGHLVVYSIQNGESSSMAAECKLRKKIHQSSVRSSYLCSNSTGWTHFSGGDDNAFCGVRLTVGADNGLTASDMFSAEDAHSSAITSVHNIPGSDHLVTTGSDQKVKVWTPEGELLSTAFTDVSDTGAMVTHGRNLITAGIGVQFFEI